MMSRRCVAWRQVLGLWIGPLMLAICLVVAPPASRADADYDELELMGRVKQGSMVVEKEQTSSHRTTRSNASGSSSKRTKSNTSRNSRVVS